MARKDQIVRCAVRTAQYKNLGVKSGRSVRVTPRRAPAELTHAETPIELPSSARETSYFWVTQRIIAAEANKRSWCELYRQFTLKDMGATEYEWDYPRTSLAHICRHDIGMYEGILVHQDRQRPVYLLGEPGRLAEQAVDLQAWVDQGYPTKKPSLFDWAFKEVEWPHGPPTIAWWALHDHVMFTLDQRVANQLLAALHSTARHIKSRAT